MDVSASWAVLDAATGLSVDVGWAEFDTTAVAANVDVSWCEFDATAKTANVDVAWCEFDVLAPADKKPTRPLSYSPGIDLKQFYDDSEKKYNIPLNVDPDDEEEILLAILAEIATYVL